MLKLVNGHDERALPVDYVLVAELGATLSDQALSDLPDALVEERRRVAAAQTLGVNHCAPAICCDSPSRSSAGRGWDWWIVVTPGGSPDDEAGVAYADDTAAVGDATAVMGSVAAMLSMITERVWQSS